MKKGIYIIVCTGVLVLFYPLSARHVITREYHGMRNGDTLYRQEVEFVDPGRDGSNLWWDYSRLTPVADAGRVVYTAESDSVLRANERGTNYFYRLTGDTLYASGYDNLTTRIDYLLPRPLLRYPFIYGDSLPGHFYQEGMYGRMLRLRASGFSTVRADAWGTLVLPEGDTLSDVLRVYEQKIMTRYIAEDDSVLFRVNRDSTLIRPDSITMLLKRDTILLKTEGWKWYARGYRYPVFESCRDRVVFPGKVQDYYCASFYFPPARQEEFGDEPNERLRIMEEAPVPDSDGPGDPRREEPLREEDVNYTVYPVPVTAAMTLEFYLHKPARVSLSVYTLQGGLICRFAPVDYGRGVYRQVIDGGGWIPGEYMLNITFDRLSYTEKILKY